MKASIRKINDNTVTVSIPYKVLLFFNIGARMSLINHDNNVVLYSPIPYDEDVFNQALTLLFSQDTVPQNLLKYVIASNDEHNLYAHQYKEKFGCKVIAGEKCKLKNNCVVDYPLTSKFENRIIKGSMWLDELNIPDPYMKNLELMYLGQHMVHDAVLFDPTSKTMFAGDLFMNLGIKGTTTGQVALEQYSPEVGYPKGYNPHGWGSFITRYCQPDSAVGRWFTNYAARTKTEEGKSAIRTIDENWDFNTLVMNHGNVIDKDAQASWKKVFAGYV
ncbi:hypothetical protein Cantr_00582 [Candida viswanathii]|uniref:Metallo-beta-lactamase domain-containing protein n=1 Tax=Candida viswanathii TaxID=5486 RepID=A0A367YHS5_9ASCO|nr:hypothetical protein Cantr_00582 [Candida viswanathii]